MLCAKGEPIRNIVVFFAARIFKGKRMVFDRFGQGDDVGPTLVFDLGELEFVRIIQVNQARR